MPKRTDIKSILILGAGPIVIGQACEFDYSGAQACKALREEGFRVILVNSNPATIMTDPAMADATYIEPIKWQSVAKIIEKERPDALLPTMGGQTALNCALDLERHGVLEKFGVEMIGANADTTQACDFRDNLAVFADAGAVVIGVSPDQPAKLATFRERDQLPFLLLSDPEHAVMEKYGAWGEKKLYGKTVTGVIRSTYVIDAEGRIELALPNCKATGHVAKLIRDLGLA